MGFTISGRKVGGFDLSRISRTVPTVQQLSSKGRLVSCSLLCEEQLENHSGVSGRAAVLDGPQLRSALTAAAESGRGPRLSTFSIAVTLMLLGSLILNIMQYQVLKELDKTLDEVKHRIELTERIRDGG